MLTLEISYSKSPAPLFEDWVDWDLLAQFRFEEARRAKVPSIGGNPSKPRRPIRHQSQ